MSSYLLVAAVGAIDLWLTMDKYGTIGVGLLAPVILGPILSCAAAIALGANARTLAIYAAAARSCGPQDWVSRSPACKYSRVRSFDGERVSRRTSASMIVPTSATRRTKPSGVIPPRSMEGPIDLLGQFA